MFVWIEDSPNVQELAETADGRKRLTVLIDKYISCAIPDIEEEPLLHALVVSLQTHGCSFTCKSKRARCRFTYPMSPCCQTVVRDTIAERRRRLYLLRRTDQEKCINAYNAMILKFWGANMDIQLVRHCFFIGQFLLEVDFVADLWRVRISFVCDTLYHQDRTN